MKTYPFWKNMQSSIESSKREINNLLAVLGRKKNSAEFKPIVILSNQEGIDAIKEIAGDIPSEVEVQLDNSVVPVIPGVIDWMIKVETVDGLIAYSKFGLGRSLIK